MRKARERHPQKTRIGTYIFLWYACEKFRCVCARSAERIKRLYGNSLPPPTTAECCLRPPSHRPPPSAWYRALLICVRLARPAATPLDRPHIYRGRTLSCPPPLSSPSLTSGPPLNRLFRSGGK